MKTMLSQWTETQNNRMESISFHSKITCNRCSKEKPEGRDGLGWFSSKNQARSGVAFNLGDKEEEEQVDICLNCIQTREETEVAARLLGQYIHHNIWRNGSLIGRRIRAIESEQDVLKKDCQKAMELLKIFNPTNKQSLLNKIERALASARIIPDPSEKGLSARKFGNIGF